DGFGAGTHPAAAGCGFCVRAHRQARERRRPHLGSGPTLDVLRRLAFAALALFAVAGAPAFAASAWQNLADPVFVRADTRELPEPAVMSLAQDRTGFLWVGTQGGLA